MSDELRRAPITPLLGTARCSLRLCPEPKW